MTFMRTDQRSTNPLTLCFLAFRFPRQVSVFALEAGQSPWPIGMFSIDHPSIQEIPDNVEALEVHSIYLLRSNDVTFLLLGMRHGFLYSVQFECDEAKSCSFQGLQKTKVGWRQVEFMFPSQAFGDKPYVFLTSDSLWEVKVKDGALEINEILFDNNRAVRPQRAFADIAKNLIWKFVAERTRARLVDGWDDSLR
jgi:hypothetical protein